MTIYYHFKCIISKATTQLPQIQITGFLRKPPKCINTVMVEGMTIDGRGTGVVAVPLNISVPIILSPFTSVTLIRKGQRWNALSPLLYK